MGANRQAFVRMPEAEQLDDEVQAWLRESYRLMGMQERLEDGVTFS
ncbi:MAG: hypothetical protein H8E44_02395 [Planctomycetes bacterium]|nr:hypothetical protein [Planctomycetota bacterium]